MSELIVLLDRQNVVDRFHPGGQETQIGNHICLEWDTEFCISNFPGSQTEKEEEFKPRKTSEWTQVRGPFPPMNENGRERALNLAPANTTLFVNSTEHTDETAGIYM